METRNIRDRLVKKPGTLDRTGVEDSTLCMMSVNSKTYYDQVLLDWNSDFFEQNLAGSPGGNQIAVTPCIIRE